MRIARFRAKDGTIYHGIIKDKKISLIKGNLLGIWEETGQTVNLDDIKLLAPIIPPNILALGRNYKAHAEESGSNLPKEPALFIKATSAITNPGDPIILPKMAPDEVDYEAELVIIIKKAARQVSEKDALDYVLGYTCGNDVSARDCQRNDAQWARAKSFETFAPLGPWIETELNPDSCDICTRLNGKVMQKANTSLMIFKTAYLIHYLSRCMTLLPGTVIFSGTPAGCGFAQNPPVWLRPGDEVKVEIEKIGVLKNYIIAED